MRKNYKNEIKMRARRYSHNKCVNRQINKGKQKTKILYILTFSNSLKYKLGSFYKH